MSAARNAVSFDFFAGHEIRSLLHRNNFSIVSIFFCNYFEIVQASPLYISMGLIQHPRALVLVVSRDVVIC